MIVVSDASILIGLSSIKRLDLLLKRFPEGIVIPPAVWNEVVEQGKGRAGASEVAQADWIRVRDLTNRGIAQLLRMELEQGEVEAIALGYEIGADVILLDERDARLAAKQLGLQVLGTVGILIWAKRAGFIPSLKESLDDLGRIGKFRFSQALYERALMEVGEESDPQSEF